MIDYNSVASKVASEIAEREAGILDRIRRKRRLGPANFRDRLLQEQQRFIELTQGAAERTQDKAVRDVAEAGKTLPLELRKRFPKT